MMLPIFKEKKLLFPQEVEVWYVLPAIRKAFAFELIASGFSQKAVAKVLGITEAAVSQYKKQKRASNAEFEEEISGFVKGSVKKVIENPSRIFDEIMAVNGKVKQAGLFCRIHRLKSWTPDGCEAVCHKHFFGAKNE